MGSQSFAGAEKEEYLTTGEKIADSALKEESDDSLYVNLNNGKIVSINSNVSNFSWLISQRDNSKPHTDDCDT